MLLFLMLETCLFKCIEPVLTHKHFLEVDLGVGGLKIGIFGQKWCKNPKLLHNFARTALIAKLSGQVSLIAKISLIAKLSGNFANSLDFANSEIAQKQFFCFFVLSFGGPIQYF